MRICKQCILPDCYPGISFDSDGVCNYCRENRDKKRGAVDKKKYIEDFERTVKDIKGKGKNYDCLVAFSGGKDSIYLAHLMKERYGMRILAVTIDTGFMSDIAIENAKDAIRKLDIDHIFYKPREGFYKRFYRYLFTHMAKEGTIPSICYYCGPVMDGLVLKMAVEKDIPIILSGYGPNQPPDTSIVYEFPRSCLTKNFFSPEIFKREPFDKQDRATVWDYERYKDKKTLPRILMPLHIFEYDEERIIEAVVQSGLVKRKRADPIKTNCRLNWAMIYLQIKKLGYPPYLDFFSELIRAGRTSRAKYLMIFKILSLQIKLGLFKRKEISEVFRKLGLTEEEILNKEWSSEKRFNHRQS